ncbi:T9SS type A sorting domain-containing protein [Nonlabens ponticola]|uniref:T9SS type A sorting domain-containing protein n=1 Tax=Nonlabens ponticola TaxID=2496866 RepID=A0A3S9MUL4_9FLAO|nr:T9SS type A sorting domain-containing protein [Nonlabens ponticola]AZQ42843.1 T9SS type A sorting domain-containing protein [Nonlabens ponticola]
MKQFLLFVLILSVFTGAAQCVDPDITDFECENPSHPITGALTSVLNPFPHDINRSENVGKYIDNGQAGFDALVVDYGSPIDLSVNPVLKLKFYSTNSVQILAKLEGGTQQELFSDFSQVNTWQEFSFDFSASQGNGNTRVVFFVNPGVENGSPADVYYLDDIRFDSTVLTPCEEPFITNFECAPFSNTINGALVTVGNSVSGGTNTSPNIGQYTDDGTQGFDALVIDYGAPIDLSVNSIFKLKFYSPSSVQILAKLEGGTVQEIFSDFSQVNTWEEFTFDFSASVGQGNTRLVLFFNPFVESGTPNDIYFIDDLQFGTLERTVYSYKNDTTGWTPNIPNDVIDPSSAIDNIVIQAGATQTTGDLLAANVTVASGAMLDAQGLNVTSTLDSQGVTNVFGTLTPNASQITSNGTLTLKSDENGTATVADATNATFNGAIAVERYIPASNRSYRLVSTAVENAGPISSNWQLNTHITGNGGASNGFDETGTNNPSMFTVNEQAAPANYEAITTTATNLEHGTGYLLFVRGDRSVDLTDNEAAATATTLSSAGTLFRGNLVLGNTQLNTGDFEAGGNGSSLIANPYQAPVNMEQVLNTATEINQEFIHVYDPTLGDRGAFVTVGFGAATDGTDDITNFSLGANAGNDASTTQASRFLQPGSAVFINTLDPGTDGTANPSLTFSEVDKAINSPVSIPFETPDAVDVNSSNALVSINLFDTAAFANNESPRDALVVRFSDQYSNALETTDALKATNLDENMASMADGQLFSIQSRALPVDEEIIDLSMTNYTMTDYTMKISINGLDDVNAYLVDNFTNTSTLLENDSVTLVEFSVDSSNDSSSSEDRFDLAFAKSTLSNTDDQATSFKLFPNPVNNGVVNVELSQVTAGPAQVHIYNSLGQNVQEIKLAEIAGVQTLDVSNLSQGIYIMEIIQDGTSTSQKVIIQ